MKTLCRLAAITLAFAGLLSCAGEPVNVTEVLNHAQCSKLHTGFTQIEFADLADIRGTRLLTMPSAAGTAATAGSATAGAGVLLFAVSKGSQPTPGYRFELMRAQAQGQEIILHYAWLTPLDDAILAQVITSPCSVIQLDDDHKVRAVSVSLDGREFGRIALNPPPS